MKIRYLTLSSLLATGLCMQALGQAQTQYASAVGDRDSIAFEEVIVSLAAAGGAGFVNVHVSVSAIVTSRADSKDRTSDAHDIAARMQPRIHAAIVESALEVAIFEPAKLGALRMKMQERAQAAFDGVYAGWLHSGNYPVELILTSMYVTDGSVSRPARSRW